MRRVLLAILAVIAVAAWAQAPVPTGIVTKTNSGIEPVPRAGASTFRVPGFVARFAPTDATEREVSWNLTLHRLEAHNGTGWEPLAWISDLESYEHALTFSAPLSRVGDTVSAPDVLTSSTGWKVDGVTNLVAGPQVDGDLKIGGNWQLDSLREAPGSAAPSFDFRWQARFRSMAPYTMNIGTFTARSQLSGTHSKGSAYWELYYDQTNGEWGAPKVFYPILRVGLADAIREGSPSGVWTWDGSAWSALALASHNHSGVYLDAGGKAADSAGLDGKDSTYFSPATHTHAHADATALQGGTTAQYYHLTEAQHQAVPGNRYAPDAARPNGWPRTAANAADTDFDAAPAGWTWNPGAPSTAAYTTFPGALYLENGTTAGTYWFTVASAIGTGDYEIAACFSISSPCNYAAGAAVAVAALNNVGTGYACPAFVSSVASNTHSAGQPMPITTYGALGSPTAWGGFAAMPARVYVRAVRTSGTTVSYISTNGVTYSRAWTASDSTNVTQVGVGVKFVQTSTEPDRITLEWFRKKSP